MHTLLKHILVEFIHFMLKDSSLFNSFRPDILFCQNNFFFVFLFTYHINILLRTIFTKKCISLNHTIIICWFVLDIHIHTFFFSRFFFLRHASKLSCFLSRYTIHFNINHYCIATVTYHTTNRYISLHQQFTHWTCTHALFPDDKL